MNHSKTALKSSRVILPQGEASCVILIQDGKIQQIVSEKEIPKNYSLLDVTPDVILPGLVDTHAHINEPGRTEWEGFETATRAALAGGITTIVDMPLNSIPPTTTLNAFQKKLKSAQGKCFIDYGFWGGLVPGNQKELLPLIDAGVLGFKSFLIDSGVEEFPFVRESDLLSGMPVLARAQVPLLVHAEVEIPLPVVSGKNDARSYMSYLNSRPKEWENRAIEWMIQLSQAIQCHVHVVHLSSAEAVSLIKKAKQQGLPITVETCPHYLTFCAEEIQNGATHFKCAPPIREKENQNQLWKGLEAGLIDFIVSDHSPCTPALKLLDKGDFLKAWGGISSLQFGISIIWKELKKRNLTLSHLVKWMSAKPAQLAGLFQQKGSIEPGKDADLITFDPHHSYIITDSHILHRHPLTPYANQEVLGEVKKVFLRGNLVYENPSVLDQPIGKWVRSAQQK